MHHCWVTVLINIRTTFSASMSLMIVLRSDVKSESPRKRQQKLENTWEVCWQQSMTKSTKNWWNEKTTYRIYNDEKVQRFSNFLKPEKLFWELCWIDLKQDWNLKYWRRAEKLLRILNASMFLKRLSNCDEP